MKRCIYNIYLALKDLFLVNNTWLLIIAYIIGVIISVLSVLVGVACLVAYLSTDAPTMNAAINIAFPNSLLLGWYGIVSLSVAVVMAGQRIFNNLCDYGETLRCDDD